ncbi:MAG: hypothetical protein HY829_15510 [Actinobacteria bacterium]|nr:hypothetical protein [Actinomycetota bacterium]
MIITITLAEWNFIVNVLVAIGTIGAAVAAVLAARSATEIAKTGRTLAETMAETDRAHAAAIAAEDRRNAAEVALADRRAAADLAAADRLEAYTREWRGSRERMAVSLIDDALAILEAWELCWRLGSIGTLLGAMNDGSQPGYREAQAHLGALLRASHKIYPVGMAAFEGARSLASREGLKESDKKALLADGEQAQKAIRREILRIIDTSRGEIVKLPLRAPGGEETADDARPASPSSSEARARKDEDLQPS